MRVLRQSEYVTVPWKNGGGLTREILKEPAGAAPFDWRVSLATIDSAGPFSAFDGYARSLTLVRGVGVELTFGPHGQAVLSRPGQMVQFDGAWPTSCRLLDGSSTDLNLIVSKERAEYNSESVPLSAPRLISSAGWERTLLCCVSGSIELTDAAGNVTHLEPVDVAVCTPDDGPVRCNPRHSTATHLFVGQVRRRSGV